MAQPQLPAEADAVPAQGRYPLGVLFIHGIGEQPEGGTLKQFADPIVKTMNLWFAGLSGGADQDTQKLHPSTTEHDKRKHLLKHASASLHGADLEALSDAGAAHVELSLLIEDSTGRKFDKLAVLAESWWAECFVPPSAGELFAWTFRVLPAVTTMHTADFVRRGWNGVRDQTVGTARRLSYLPGLSASLAGMLLLPALILLLQILLSITLVLYLFPSSALKKWVLSVQQGLVVTLGDSFLFADSPVSRAMMTGKVSRDLAALSASCEKVSIVAHSQGCAVSAAALTENIPDNLVSVTWLGSGVRKLEQLSKAALQPAFIAAGWLITTVPWALLLLIPKEFAAWTFDSVYATLTLGVLAVAGLLSAATLMLADTRAREAHNLVSRLIAKGVEVNDVYARIDPVSNGPLGFRAEPENSAYRSHEVRNRNSAFSDHTTYLQNLEEVVLPVALQMFRQLGLPPDNLLSTCPEWLAGLNKDRGRRVRLLLAMNIALLLSIAWAVALHPDVWFELAHGSSDWIRKGLSGTTDDTTLTSLFKPVWHIVAICVIAYFLLQFIWRGLDIHQQENAFRRRGSSRTILAIIAASSVLVLSLPLYPVLYTYRGFTLYDLLYIAFMFPFMAFVFVFLQGLRLRQ